MTAYNCLGCKRVYGRRGLKKIGSRYYCPNCGEILHTKLGEKLKLPKTWWR